MKTKPARTSQFLVVLVFFCGILFAQAQTFYALQIDRNIREKARDITAEYQPSLVMGAEQALDFQSTVAKYLVKRKSIEDNANMSEGEKRHHLKTISKHESFEMADVLYPYQYQEYLRVKPEIQPLPPKNTGFEDAIADNQTTN
ncbi:hypothetical protein SAMN05421766_103504 [Zobellia uliginosa]|uniref:Uncharacterized protein n=1 Tax=Zobellia uliginosa TaxID=143224 RepID=A0ABY1KS12_9FLAO|nr:hypothetical protein [Zobellia uliginosa]SIS70589.1 hypothetical protein SAMN05421766_103504 [Zobellia uliginosa]